METMKEKINNYLWNYNGRKIRYGYGGARLGRQGRTDRYGKYVGDPVITTETIRRDADFLRKCYDAGCRYFETGRYYGESELVYGEFIKEIDRKSIFLATKSLFWFREKGMQAAFEEFRQNFYDSFERLGVDHIDLFQIHDTNDYTACCCDVLPFLEDRQKEGMIDYIGFAMRDMVPHNQAIVSGRVQSCLTFQEYNLIKSSTKETMELAKKHGVCFINCAVLLDGRLLEPEEIPDHVVGNRRTRLEQVRLMRSLCWEMGVDVITASYLYSLFNPDVDLTLCGINNDYEFDFFLRTLDTFVYPEQWAAIEALRNTFSNLYIQDEQM